ncbi:MAG: ChrR family anti-sigma-E factor [Rhodospirillaceae bacterium]
MTIPVHHPGEEILLDYAGGSLREPFALVIATHLAFCPCCRTKVAELEAIGGALLEAEEPASLSKECLPALLKRLGTGSAACSSPRKPSPSVFAKLPTEVIRIPEPLRSYLGKPLEQLCWCSAVGGIEQVDIQVGGPPIRTRLLRMKPGGSMPRHYHPAIELNLVLLGGFRDERGSYRRGDLVIDEPTLTHHPIADDGEGCLCLNLAEAPIRFTGLVARLTEALRGA